MTIPTALAIAEIATNQRVEGGGEYFIISRSFGILVGAAIGVALYLSQAISVAFYVVAFGEAFDPVFAYGHDALGLSVTDKRLLTLPSPRLVDSADSHQRCQRRGQSAVRCGDDPVWVAAVFFSRPPDLCPRLNEPPAAGHRVRPGFFFPGVCDLFPGFYRGDGGGGLSW